MAEIAVIVASKNMGQSAVGCLTALFAQCVAREVELIVADASSDGTADIVADRFPAVRLLRGDENLLVPQLWQLGIDESQAPIVALTILQCRPAPGWLEQISSCLAGEAAAVGGPLNGPANGSRRDWALYFSRYSNWMPAAHSAGPILDVAGDNAAYKRAALAGCPETTAGGFWENLVNACLVQHGETLLWSPELKVEFQTAEPLRQIIQVRFRHGRVYGSTRSGNNGVNRLVRLLTTPFLPALLWSRIARRVQQNRPEWLPQLFQATIPLLLILCAWSAGEAAGYAWPERPET